MRLWIYCELWQFMAHFTKNPLLPYQSIRIFHGVTCPRVLGVLTSTARCLALSSDPASMAQAAKYYEQKGQPSKAWWTEEELCYPSSHNHLPGGFKYSLFSTIFGEDSQFDKYFWDGLKPPTSHDFNKMVPLNWQDGYFAMRRVIGLENFRNKQSPGDGGTVENGISPTLVSFHFGCGKFHWSFLGERVIHDMTWICFCCCCFFFKRWFVCRYSMIPW